MIISPNLIFTVAQLAVEFGESVIVPIINACHHDKTNEQKAEAVEHVKHLTKSHETFKSENKY